jgi:hypothetical protein
MTEKAQLMLRAMREIDSNHLGSFDHHFSELSKLYFEAKDNVKFLSTLERHFKHLHDGSFQSMIEVSRSTVAFHEDACIHQYLFCLPVYAEYG